MRWCFLHPPIRGDHIDPKKIAYKCKIIPKWRDVVKLDPLPEMGVWNLISCSADFSEVMTLPPKKESDFWIYEWPNVTKNCFGTWRLAWQLFKAWKRTWVPKCYFALRPGMQDWRWFIWPEMIFWLEIEKTGLGQLEWTKNGPWYWWTLKLMDPEMGWKLGRTCRPWIGLW